MFVFLRNPGLTEEQALTELDLTYKSRFAAEGKAPRIPGAYERLILEVIKGTPAGKHLKIGQRPLSAADELQPVCVCVVLSAGDHRLFVRDDELAAGTSRSSP